MKDKKLYYTDPLAAAYMAREFGVKLQGILNEKIVNIHQTNPDDAEFWTEGSEEVEPDGSESVNSYLGKQFYIHPDSYHIFEPQVGDLLQNEDGAFMQFLGASGGLKILYAKVIQRNNKPFFTPELEQ